MKSPSSTLPSVIDECAAAVTTQLPGTRYQWRTDSLFGDITRSIANHLRTLIHPAEQSREDVIEACAKAASTFPRGDRYGWVAQHNFHYLTGEMADRIRRLKTV